LRDPLTVDESKGRLFDIKKVQIQGAKMRSISQYWLNGVVRRVVELRKEREGKPISRGEDDRVNPTKYLKIN
jgi:hypothetical protein